MRSAAWVWLLGVVLLNLQGCAENQVAPPHAGGNTPLAQRASAFSRPSSQGHPVLEDNFPPGETDVTDEGVYDNYQSYDSFPSSLSGEENVEDLISQIQEEMAWSNGHPEHLAQIRHAIAKVREAIERRAAADKSHATAARNDVEENLVSEAGRAEEGENLATKIRQSLAKSEELLKKASVGEQRDYDVREPSSAVLGDHREGSERADEVQHASDGVVVAPHLWQKARRRDHQGVIEGPAWGYQADTARVNDEIAEAKLMLHLLENPIWAEWSGWSRCHGQCGTGYRTRTRACRIQGLCEQQTAAEPCPLKDECENPRGYVAGTVAVSVLAVLLVTMLATFLLLPKIQKYRISRYESEREAFIQANLKKNSSMPDRPPPAAPRPASTLPAKLPSGEHVYLTLSEVKVDGKTYLAQAGKSAEDCVYLTPSQINQPKTEMYLNQGDDLENEEEEENRDEENAYLVLQGAN
ncbi:uncharacterized protein LOC144920940 isoform X1 [Branchiostoma floridae x Branchiostoma belcheri]